MGSRLRWRANPPVARKDEDMIPMRRASVCAVVAAAMVVMAISSSTSRVSAQAKTIGITPDDIKYIGISHNHADHTGNIELFKKAEVLIQKREYDFMFKMNGGKGPSGPPGAEGPVMEKDHPHKLLDGDYDVF